METSAPSTGERLRSAPVLEVFASIQGEGLYAGRPQTFLRLAGCPLRCRWCDTPGSWEAPALPPNERSDAGDAGDRAARIRGRDAVRRRDPWATPFQAATWIGEVEGEVPRPISVTGGEPLMWPGFLAELKGFVGPRRVHLETAGGHPRALERVLAVVDHVSLDLKLPADLDPPVALPGAPEPPPASPVEWAHARARCLELVRGRDAALKLVVAGGREPRAFVRLFDDVAAIAPELPLFLQPVTPMRGVPAPGRDLLLALVDLALARALDVRLVPQLHRVLGLP